MNEQTKINVPMTADELAEYQRMKADKERKALAEKAKQDREAYRSLVDEAIEASMPELAGLSGALAEQKAVIYKRFEEVIEMKSSLFRLKEGGQWSHTFTNSAGTMRIKVGSHTLDYYDDTADVGVEKVREYIASLAGDNPKTRELVDMVMRLLQKDAKSGQLKATRVLQLDKLAQESGSEEFIEGVRIIKEAYRPTASKRYVRAEVKDETGAWKNIPLGMTEV